jgi:hypothetical protein
MLDWRSLSHVGWECKHQNIIERPRHIISTGEMASGCRNVVSGFLGKREGLNPSDFFDNSVWKVLFIF